MVKLRNIKDLINSRMRLMNNMEGPKVLINLNGQERKKIHIIKLMEASCGAPNKTTTKMMEKKKIIQNIFGVHLQPEAELDLSIRMIRGIEIILMKMMLQKERKRVLHIIICLILVKLLGVLNVAAFHKSNIKNLTDLKETPDTLMIISIQRLEHPKIILTIYKNNFLIK